MTNLLIQVLSRAALAVHDSEPATLRHTLQSPDLCRALECSVAGPQVRPRPRQPPPQLYQLAVPLYQSVELGHSLAPAQPASHIYMEVDPLYCDSQQAGLGSSTSSQTSSGYSTAPSLPAHHETQSSQQTKDRVFSISGQCEHARSSQHSRRSQQ